HAERVEVLYIGQVSYRKGIPVLLEAARRCNNPSVMFRMYGPVISPELLSDLPSNVTYEGLIPHGAKVADVMRRADLFILPSVEDACALVTLEAMATGVPVVTTSHNGAGELIEHEKDGLIVAPGDSAVLSDAV